MKCISDVEYFSPEEIKDLELRFDFRNVIADFQGKGSKELPLHHYNI